MSESEPKACRCYAEIFTSQRTSEDPEGYARVAEHMEDLARQQPGFLGIESARDEHGVGATISYWESLEAIRRWREHAEHQVAQRLGKEKWYDWYRLRIAGVVRESSFDRQGCITSATCQKRS